MTIVKIAPALRCLPILALLPLAACSDSGDVDTAAATYLGSSDVAKSCEAELRRVADVPYTVLTVYGFDVPEFDTSSGTFTGELPATLHNDEFAGEFTFTCTTDGVNAEVSNFHFPPENFIAPPPEDTSPATPTSSAAPAAVPPPTVPKADPQRLDPQNNGAGRAGRDDNLGILYHNRQDWLFLEAPGKIVPGGRIYNTRTGGYCSTGFIASRDNRAFIVTAGHCGNVGDQFLVEDSYGGQLVIGEMVESFVEGSSTAITGADIGLIELYDEAKPHVDAALPLNEKLQGWITPQEAAKRDMTICRLGSTTGYSCGVMVGVEGAGQFSFRNIVDRGDSGGAIFAYDSSGPWALGVTSNGSDYNKTLLYGMEIAGAMQHWGLQLHG